MKCLPVCDTAPCRLLAQPRSHLFRWDSFVLPRQSWAASGALPEDRLHPLMAKTCTDQGAVTSPGQWRIANVMSHGRSSESSARWTKPGALLDNGAIKLLFH